MTYDPNPSYPVTDGEVEVGYGAAGGRVRTGGRPDHSRSTVRRPFPGIASSRDLVEELARRGVRGRARRRSRLSRSVGRDRATDGDERPARRSGVRPHLRRRPRRALRRARRVSESEAASSSCSAPGSALVEHDLLWYADLPKWLSLAAVARGEAGNLGQPPGETGSEQRLLFVDWPVLDRHKQGLLPRLDRYVDLSEPASPRSLAGDALRRTLARPGGAPVSHPSDVLAGAVGRTVAPRQARDLDRGAEPRLVLRADHARERDPPRRRRNGRGRLRAAHGGGRRAGSRIRACSAVRSLVPDPVRLPGHVRRRRSLDPVPPVRGRTCARRSDSRTRSTRRTTSWTRSPARRSSSACAKTPISRPSGWKPNVPRTRGSSCNPSGTCRRIPRFSTSST